MGNVHLSILSLALRLIASGFIAGSGKSVLWCVNYQLIVMNVAYAGD